MASYSCGVYLAESTIPNAGLGMFAGIQYNASDIITAGDLYVPAIEMQWHNGFGKFNFLWDEYTWSANMFDGMVDEVEDHESISIVSFGTGSAVNCMMSLVNLKDHIKDDEGPRNAGVSSQSPAAGAFTPYHDRSFEAKIDIPQGSELFANYGESYFKSRKKYEGVPLFEDFERADELIQSFQNLTRSLPQLSPSFTKDIWDLIRNPDVWSNERLGSALPSNYTTLSDVIQSGGTAMGHQNKSIRSTEWLQENGACMDNIRGGVSTIPDAGRGAFARRFIKKGELVAPAPLVHLPSRGVLDMFEEKVITKKEGLFLARDATKPIHKQLLLNYCFGHRQSSLLLCPYGHLTALINHSHQSPNTKIVWSKDTFMSHPEWRDLPLESWGGKKTAGLSFDLVALRDIDTDEEIFIDYGEEWELAWQEHVQNFKVHRPLYIPAFELNAFVDIKLYTDDEYSYKSDGVFIFCRRIHILLSGIDIEEATDWEGYEDEPRISDGIYPCRVIKRNNADSYMAELVIRKQVEDDEVELFQTVETFSHVLFDVPRDAFYFRDDFYSRDHHKSWSFRHDMRLDDKIFPEIWKNRKDEQEL